MMVACHVTFGFRGSPVLRDVSFELKPGELVGVIGPNGSGKSTLLRLCAGERVPERGEILLNGRPILGWTGRERARRLAVLAQEQPLSFPFSVREVVELAWCASGGAMSAAHRRASAELLERFELQHLAGRPYTRLSGGERQRTQLARVLAQICVPLASEPRFLLLDEPTNHLDLRFQRELRGIVRELAKEGVGVLIVSHDVPFLSQCVDEIFLLSCGRVIAAGPPGGIFGSPVTEATFGVRFVFAQESGGSDSIPRLVVPELCD
jgi:iron complex transport system ATP-binding protein